jgi:hypothetical protein
MTEIQQVVSNEYRKAKFTWRLMSIAAVTILLLPLYYEADLNFIHIRALEHLSLASIYVIMVWLSGFCFGSAMFYRKVIKKMEGLF